MSKNQLLCLTLIISLNVLAIGKPLHENINVENDLTFNEGNIQNLLLSNDIKASSVHTEAIKSPKLTVASLYVEKISNPSGENVKVNLLSRVLIK
mgnify:CR=1 FL=1